MNTVTCKLAQGGLALSMAAYTGYSTMQLFNKRENKYVWTALATVAFPIAGPLLFVHSLYTNYDYCYFRPFPPR